MAKTKITKEQFGDYIFRVSQEVLLSSKKGLENPNLSKEEAAFLNDMSHIAETYLIKQGVKISDVIGNNAKTKEKKESNESSGN